MILNFMSLMALEWRKLPPYSCNLVCMTLPTQKNYTIYHIFFLENALKAELPVALLFQTQKAKHLITKINAYERQREHEVVPNSTGSPTHFHSPIPRGMNFGSP